MRLRGERAQNTTRVRCFTLMFLHFARVPECFRDTHSRDKGGVWGSGFKRCKGGGGVPAIVGVHEGEGREEGWDELKSQIEVCEVWSKSQVRLG
jgi:hypothetical protein